MVRAGRALQAAVTSEATEKLAVSLGIPIIRPETGIKVDLAIDGVDEIDDSFCAVKGGGGALLREKVVARRADQVIWIMDESKLVKRLGTFPFPAEVLPFVPPGRLRRSKSWEERRSAVRGTEGRL